MSNSILHSEKQRKKIKECKKERKIKDRIPKNIIKDRIPKNIIKDRTSKNIIKDRNQKNIIIEEELTDYISNIVNFISILLIVMKRENLKRKVGYGQ